MVCLRCSTRYGIVKPIFPMRQFLLSVLILFLLAACSREKAQYLPPGSPVLALGDSLTEGYGVAPAEAWPDLLAKKTGWRVVNGGVSGDTSADALQRLPELSASHQPVLVLVMLGGNDMLRRAPKETTVANLEKILAEIKSRGAKAVLLAVPQPSVAGAAFRNLTAADFYQEVADSRNVPLIKDAVAEVLSDPKLKDDPLHPNSAGHALLFAKIFESLKAMGYAR